jgi:hypothetical protein
MGCGTDGDGVFISAEPLLERVRVDRDHFDGSELVYSGRRGGQRDAGTSGKRRNAPEEPIRPTFGRVLLPRGIVTLLIRCVSIAFQSAPCHGTK